MDLELFSSLCYQKLNDIINSRVPAASGNLMGPIQDHELSLVAESILPEIQEEDIISFLKHRSISARYSDYISSWYFKNKNKEAGRRIAVRILRKIYINQPKYKKTFIENAEGYFLIWMLKESNNILYQSLFEKLKKSKHPSCRRLYVEKCKISEVEQFLVDSEKRVRSAAIKRLGMQNVYSKMLKDRSMYIRIDALQYVTDATQASTVLASITEDLKKKSGGFYTKYYLSRTIKKLPKVAIINNLDLASFNDKHINHSLNEVLNN